MSKINNVNYIIETDNVDMDIVLLTDLHYYSRKDIKKFNRVLDSLKQTKFDYICIVGDFIDQGIIKDEECFIDWLKKLSCLSKIIITMGGHDMIKTKKIKEYYYNEELYEKIKKIKNVTVLDNEDLIIGNVRFIGLTMPFDYYFKYKESLLYFKKFVNAKFDMYEDKYNILLSHTPIPLVKLDNYKEVKLLNNVQLVLSGHTHAGIVPKFLRGVMKGRAIFAPHHGKMFQKDFYGLINRGKTKIVISTGITKAAHSNRYRFTDFMFDNEIVIVNLKKKAN